MPELRGARPDAQPYMAADTLAYVRSTASGRNGLSEHRSACHISPNLAVKRRAGRLPPRTLFNAIPLRRPFLRLILDLLR